MESSEELPYCSLDSDDASLEAEQVDVASYDNCASEYMPLNQDTNQSDEDMAKYFDEDYATLFLNSQIIALKKDLPFAQGPGNEICVLLNNEGEPSIERALSQALSLKSNNIHTSAMHCGLNNVGTINTEGIKGVKRNDDLQSHNMGSDNNCYSSEALIQKKHNTQIVFVTTSSKRVPLTPNYGYVEYEGFFKRATVISKPYEQGDIESAREASEGSFIVSQIHADSYSSKVEDEPVAVNEENNSSLYGEHMASVVETSSPTMEERSFMLSMAPQDIDSYSSKVVDEHGAVNEENNNNLYGEHMASVVETSSPTMEEHSFMLSMPPQDIDHAVSVIHTATSTPDHDCRANIQEDERQKEEASQSKLTLPTVSTNLTYFECSNLKESLDSELFSEIPFIEESSNHSDIKGNTDFSNKDNANCKTFTVKETVDEFNHESIQFPFQLHSSEIIVDEDSKQVDSIICNNYDSSTSLNFDLSKNLDSKIFYPSSKNYENEMDYTNSEGTCSEIQACAEKTFLSLGDNSESKSSFLSNNSQSKDNLHILKSVNPSKVNIIDVYNFETNSNNLDQELSNNSSLDKQLYDLVNPDTEVDATKDSQSVSSNIEDETQNLTFQGVLTPVTDNSKLKNLADGKNSETYDNSPYLFDQDPQYKGEHNSMKIVKSTHVKFGKHKQNSDFSEIKHTNEDKIYNENISVKNDVNVSNETNDDGIVSVYDDFDKITVITPLKTYGRKKKTPASFGVELFSGDFFDNESSPTQILCLDEKEQIMNDEYDLVDEDGYVNLLPSIIKNRKSFPVDESTVNFRSESSDQNLEKNPDFVMNAEGSVSTCDVNIDNESKENDSTFSNIMAFHNFTVKHAEKTYARKKKFSGDFSGNEPCTTSKIFRLEEEKEQNMTDECISADEDGYVNLMPSYTNNRISTYPVDENTINLRPESPDQTLLEENPDLDSDFENSVTYSGTYLIDLSFTPMFTEKDAQKSSSPDFPKVASPRNSLKKRVQTLLHEKMCAKKKERYKSGKLRDKMDNSSSIKLKNASSSRRKMREKVKKKIGKTVKNLSSPVSKVYRKRRQPSKEDVKGKRNLHSSSSLKNIKNFCIKFLDDKSTENDKCLYDELSTPSTSTQDLGNLQYSCPHCNFVSSRVNNLVTHYRYCTFKPPYNRKDYQTRNMRQWSRRLFPENFATQEESSSSQDSNDSIIHNRKTATLPTTLEALHGMLNKPHCECKCYKPKSKPHYQQ